MPFFSVSRHTPTHVAFEARLHIPSSEALPVGAPGGGNCLLLSHYHSAEVPAGCTPRVLPMTVCFPLACQTPGAAPRQTGATPGQRPYQPTPARRPAHTGLQCLGMSQVHAEDEDHFPGTQTSCVCDPGGFPLHRLHLRPCEGLGCGPKLCLAGPSS